MKPLTPAAIAFLRDVKHGAGRWTRRGGLHENGARAAMIERLISSGLVVVGGMHRSDFHLTPAGKAALEESSSNEAS